MVMRAWVCATQSWLQRKKASSESASTLLAVMVFPMEGAMKNACLIKGEELVSMNIRSMTRSMAWVSCGLV